MFGDNSVVNVSSRCACCGLKREAGVLFSGHSRASAYTPTVHCKNFRGEITKLLL